MMVLVDLLKLIVFEKDFEKGWIIGKLMSRLW